MSHLTSDQIAELIAIDNRCPGIRKEVQELICQLTSGSKVKNLAQMVALGNYDYVNEDIVERNFPTDPVRFTTGGTKVFLLSHEMTTARLKETMVGNGCEPGLIESLLAYGAEHPEEQRDHPIVALGSSWVSSNGHRYVPYLYGGRSQRGLHLDRGGSERRWGTDCRFLARCK